MNYIYKFQDDKFLEYFEKNNFNMININNINLLDSKDKILIINQDCDEYIKKDLYTNIILLYKPVINNKSLQQYDYILPMNPILYSTYAHSYGFKILFPINLLNETVWLNYFIDQNLIKTNNFIKNGTLSSIHDSKILIYQNLEELEKTSLNTNIKIIKYNNDNISKKKINDYMYITEKFLNNNNIIIPSKLNYKILYLNDYKFDKKIKFNNDKYLIVRKGFNTKISSEYFSYLFDYKFKCYSLFVKTINDYEFGILFNSEEEQELTLTELIKKIEYQDSRIIGTNDVEMDLQNIINLYYLFGLNLMYEYFQHLSSFQNRYFDLILKYVLNIIINDTLPFNKNKFIKILAYWCGVNNYEINVDSILEFIKINEKLFGQEKVFLLSKSITDYGGNQKTGLQIYNELILYGYDVKICCFTKEDLVYAIDKNDILKIYNINDVLNEINNNDYKIVIINKLDEYLNIVNKINKKSIFITHNSMDPVNRKIIDNHKFLDKVFTVNNEHINLLYENNSNCEIQRYINYVDPVEKKINHRFSFKYNLLYVGRISKEKNIEFLINAFNRLLDVSENKELLSNIKLTIIGDGKLDFVNTNKNIHFLGRQDKNTILYYLTTCDYLILPSLTEGLPYVILEAMSIGIPIITSNITGCNEAVVENIRGFLFNYELYDNYKNIVDNWTILDNSQKIISLSEDNLINTIIKAYSIHINTWNIISDNCYNYIQQNYNSKIEIKNNINLIFNNNISFITDEKVDEYYIKLFNFIKFNDDLNSSELIISINNFTDLMHNLQLFKTNDININLKYVGLFMENLNKIKYDIKMKKISKIIDSNNNYILLNSIEENILKIQPISTFFY